MVELASEDVQAACAEFHQGFTCCVRRDQRMPVAVATDPLTAEPAGRPVARAALEEAVELIGRFEQVPATTQLTGLLATG